MMSLREKAKETLWTLSGIGLFILALAIYNGSETLGMLHGVYLRHLKTEEDAIQKKLAPLHECEKLVNQVEQYGKLSQSCLDILLVDYTKELSEARELHERRLRSEVRWGDAELDGAKELGWNYARPQWDGHKAVCPEGTKAYEIEIEMLSGADQFVHCLSGIEAAEYLRAEGDDAHLNEWACHLVYFDLEYVQTVHCLSEIEAARDDR
jgi:hypothetical protein